MRDGLPAGQVGLCEGVPWQPRPALHDGHGAKLCGRGVLGLALLQQRLARLQPGVPRERMPLPRLACLPWAFAWQACHAASTPPVWACGMLPAMLVQAGVFLTKRAAAASCAEGPEHCRTPTGSASSTGSTLLAARRRPSTSLPRASCTRSSRCLPGSHHEQHMGAPDTCSLSGQASHHGCIDTSLPPPSGCIVLGRTPV